MTSPARLASRTAHVLLAGLAAATLVACTSDSGSGTPAAPAVAAPTGPLCDELPSGNQPGNPTALAREPADVALQWIPVLTKFEAAIRASGLAADLRDAKGLTVLAPTDDAFERKISQRAYDEFVLSRKEDLRALLKSHLVDRSLSVADLHTAGKVTTLAGTPVAVSRDDVVCGDYQVANARIHIIKGVLGNVPTTAGSDDPAH